MINEFYYKILNIRNSSINISQILQKTMEELNKEYSNIEKAQMCKVFANNISKILSDNNIDNRILNTKAEFGVYEHEVVLCRGKEDGKIKYFLIDYTFSQFFSSNKYFEIINNSRRNDFFNKLLRNGYVEVNNDEIIRYLRIFDNSIFEFNLDDYFNDIDKKYKK